MKKLFPFLALCLFVFAACEPDPVLSLDKDVIEFDAAGGSQTVAVSANNTWNVMVESTDSFYTVSPTSGEGNGYITVTVQPNNTQAGRSGQVAVVCSSRSTSMTKAFKINQPCPVGKAEVEACVLDPDENGKVPATGGTVKLTLTSNGMWDISCDAADVVIKPKEGGLNIQNETTATVPACPVFEGRTITFSIRCETQSGATTTEYKVEQAGGVLVYGGEVYQTAKMKDGKWWMTENLRYIPAGMSPSDDVNAVTNGIWYPVVINELTPDVASVKFSTSDADIKAQGYLYNTETALGLKTGDLTAENCKNYEGVQGICPAGWHIPTKADIVGLVGKTNATADTNPDAPYFDADLNGGNGSVAKLNADGFNAGAWGALSIANTTMVKGTLMGAIKAYQGGMNTGYIAGSTLVDTGKNLTTNADGSLKNCQFLGLMPYIGNGTYNGALNNFRNGVTVRCVKNN
jgi:uncharacterized protein (TIGR02145 family)